MRFRQIHLDFHTSPFIEGIGEAFDRREWQERLRDAAVDSITCFSSCHHGWSYHPTEVGRMHPHLKFNLLREQIDACHEIGINVPVYLTAGVNEMKGREHPEWREIDCEGRWSGWNHSPLEPGFPKLCFNTPYLDYLCRQIEETVTLFPDADGIFLDIISQGPCCCKYCMAGMKAEGFDPTKPEDRLAYARKVLLKYYQRSTAAARSRNPKMPVFHNSGHVTMGDTEILKYFSHLELESLPTGGWGYDHYPMSAAYCRNLGMEFLGMTGKFHTTWGEFGGFKHPNALRYECAAMIANGSKCSVGDQLHPSGRLDKSTYEIIGAAYRDVAKKEAWCDKVESAARVAVLGKGAATGIRGDYPSDVGVARVLLEEHIPFDFVDSKMDFLRYGCLILPDEVRVDETLAGKLRDFLAKGGKLILSGTSGMASDRDEFLFDIGAEFSGASPYLPDYVEAAPEFAPEFVGTPFVMYGRSQRIKVRNGESLGKVFDPYFNRTYEHFCSHQHTPYRMEPSGYDAGVCGGSILYFAHPVFTIYRGWGAVAVREYIGRAIRRFLGEEIQLEVSLPSQGRATLMHQKEENRYVLHLLYANTILRGGEVKLSGGNLSATRPIEVIEELNPCPPAKVSLKFDETPRSVKFVPEGNDVPFTLRDGRVEFEVPAFTCHRMVEIAY